MTRSGKPGYAAGLTPADAPAGVRPGGFDLNHPQDAGGQALADKPSPLRSALHRYHASWLNLVERWFAELTTKKLRRGTHTSVRQLNTNIRAWIDNWNANPRPYVWAKTADQILESIANYCKRINDSGR